MIIEQAKQAISQENDEGKAINLLADEFRGGRNLSELIELLNVNDDHLVEVGLWILGEVNFNLQDATKLIESTKRHLGNCNPAIRYQALKALYPYWKAKGSDRKSLLSKLTTDQNYGVRTLASRILMEVSTNERTGQP